MASRFEMVDEEYIEELKDKSENENTKNSTYCWKNVFKRRANERNFAARLGQFQQLLKTRVVLMLILLAPMRLPIQGASNKKLSGLNLMVFTPCVNYRGSAISFVLWLFPILHRCVTTAFC